MSVWFLKFQNMKSTIQLKAYHSFWLQISQETSGLKKFNPDYRGALFILYPAETGPCRYLTLKYWTLLYWTLQILDFADTRTCRYWSLQSWKWRDPPSPSLPHPSYPIPLCMQHIDTGPLSHPFQNNKHNDVSRFNKNISFTPKLGCGNERGNISNQAHL